MASLRSGSSDEAAPLSDTLLLSANKSKRPSQKSRQSKNEHSPKKRSKSEQTLPSQPTFVRQSENPDQAGRSKSDPDHQTASHLTPELAQKGLGSQPAEPGHLPEPSPSSSTSPLPTPLLLKQLKTLETPHSVPRTKSNYKNKRSGAAILFFLLSFSMFLLVVVVISSMVVRSALKTIHPMFSFFRRPEFVDSLTRTANFSVNPCQDFHSFVCGASSAQWRGSMLSKAYKTTFYNVSLQLHLDERSGMSKGRITLMRFYRSCLQPADSPMETDRQAMTLLMHVNETWGVLASNLTESMLFQLLALMSLRYDISAVLSTNIVSSGRSDGSLLLRLAPGRSLASRWGGDMAYFTDSIDRMLTWTNSYFQWNVTIGMINQMETALNLGSFETERNFTNASIEEAANAVVGVSEKTFQNHVSAALPAGIQFSDLVEIQISERNAVKHAMMAFFRTDQRAVAITLALLHVFATVFNRLISLQYRQRRTQPSFRSCEFEASSFGEVWRLAALDIVPKDATLLFGQIRRIIIARVLKRLVDHCSPEHELKRSIYDKLTKLRVHLPSDNVYPDITLPVMTHNFATNYIALKRYSQEVKLRRARTLMSEGSRVGEEPGFGYFANENSVYLTPAWLQQPLFYPNADPFINYAAIGVVLAGLLHQAVGRSGRYHDADGEEKSWWTAEMAEAVYQQQECYKREYIDVNRGRPSPVLLDEIWAITEGLKVVWHDVVAHSLDGRSAEIHGRTFTWKQVFFLRFCSVWCNYAWAPSENAWRCNAPLRHLPGFASTFNCSAGHAMSYRKSCSLKLPCR